jgi:hypothetical protein
MDNKGVRFTNDGLTYTMPVTHYFTFLPDPVADGIEFVSSLGRKAYYGALEFAHDEAIEMQHLAVEWMNESGGVTVLLYLCGTYLTVAMLSWVINRFTDGLWPSDRALAKETRRRADEYIARKREL